MAAVAALLGRIFLAAIFILSGISKIGGYQSTVTYMEAHGIPVAPLFLYAAVLIELGCGLSLATGYRARWSALALAVFLIPTTYLFHFKPAFDAAMNVTDRMQMIQVLKNVAIIGSCLMVFGNGAGKFTIGKDA